MQIGKIIRIYRKQKHMTQEELANRLGVTASAVNKWENGNSMPDITLLAPIARLLGITLDRLLSFQEELTPEEQNQFIKELDMRLQQEPYGEVFLWAKHMLETYPNCDQLLWQTALVLDAHRLTKSIPDPEKKYESFLQSCYTRALGSKDETIRTRAADSLFGFYTNTGEYAKAEEMLAYFSLQNPERKRKQALLYSKTNRIPEAYRAYEELLFSDYQILNMIFHSLFLLAIQENDSEKACAFTEKKQKLAELFEMGPYHESSCRLDLAIAQKDTEAAIDVAGKILASVDDISHFRHSFLYAHMPLKDLPKDFSKGLRKKLLECFSKDEQFGFLQNNTRWQILLKQE